MLRRILSKSILKTGYLFNSTHKYFYCMEAPKEIRVIDYKIDQYGDYPFIQSTYQSGRKWVPLGDVTQNF